MKPASVTNIRSKKPADRTRSSLQPVLREVLQIGLPQLRHSLRTLFDNTDDALFELADKSETDAQQALYFDAMRHIRLHRKEICSNFERDLPVNFHERFKPSEAEKTPKNPEPITDESDIPDFGLVDNDELEVNVAIAGMVSKITSRLSLPLVNLTRRLGTLAPDGKLTERDNPLGPHQLSVVFSQSVADLKLDIRIRIILLKLFERFVLERLGPTYEALNLHLKEAGIEPPNNQAKRATRSAPQPAPVDTVESIGDSASNSMPFSSVQELMHAQRPVNTGAGYPLISSGTLLTSLQQLQAEQAQTQLDITAVPEPMQINSLILSAHPQKSMQSQDYDVVKLVSMLFDYILNDRNLAIPMKALIARLQIPVVKVALLDTSFFEQSHHPARALLNELSSAGIGWSSSGELKRDKIYNKVEWIVASILNEYESDPGIFRRLLDNLRSFVKGETKKSELVEQRVKDTEAGRAKTLQAKLEVQTIVNQKASGMRMPPEAGRFISETWTKVLIHKHLKYGNSSEQWHSGIDTLDALLWALQPLSDLESIDKRDATNESLLADISIGLKEINMPEAAQTRFAQWLTNYLNELGQNDRAYLEDDEKPFENDDVATLQEVVLAPEPEPVAIDALDTRVKQTLTSFTEGSWLEFAALNGKVTRGRLATISQPHGRYVFVNERGMKIADKSKAEMVELIEADKVKLIDESQVFDRALQSVIGSLRAMQEKR